MFKGDKKIEGYNRPYCSPGSIMIILGALLLCLLLLGSPFYTFAQEADSSGDGYCRIIVSPDTPFELKGLEPGGSYSRSLSLANPGKVPIYLWLKMERTGGDPLPGEPGDLFSQLDTTIAWDNMDLYSGPMSGLQEPLNISGKVGPIRPGQTLDLDLLVSLPGPETGNEFQGSSVTTNIILITRCGDLAEEPSETPGSDPGGDGKKKDESENGGKESELPRTNGFALALNMLPGFSLILLGLLMKRKGK